jgi:uncharacterized membrane protein YphA (DoxX/SURF4 family)
VGLCPASLPIAKEHQVLRRLARPLLGATFVAAGVDALRDGDRRARQAGSLGVGDPQTVTRTVAGAQIGAGALLTLGRFPRLSSMLLAGSLVPTTLAGHRFWEEKDPEERYRQRGNFLKNVGLLGGLILAAVDTEGRPGLAWRAKHATHHAAAGTRRARRTAKREARLAAHATRAKLPV